MSSNDQRDESPIRYEIVRVNGREVAIKAPRVVGNRDYWYLKYPEPLQNDSPYLPARSAYPPPFTAELPGQVGNWSLPTVPMTLGEIRETYMPEAPRRQRRGNFTSEFSAPRIKLSRLLTTPEDPNAGPQLQGVNQGFQTADTNSPGTHPQLNTGAQIQQLSPSLRRGSAPAIGDFTPAYNTIWSPTENLGAPPGTFAMQPSSSGVSPAGQLPNTYPGYNGTTMNVDMGANVTPMRPGRSFGPSTPIPRPHSTFETYSSPMIPHHQSPAQNAFNYSNTPSSNQNFGHVNQMMTASPGGMAGPGGVAYSPEGAENDGYESNTPTNSPGYSGWQ